MNLAEMENKILTPEQQKQVYIIRQSQMERAIEYYQSLNKKVSAKLLINTADVFSDYIINGMSQSVLKRIKTLDTYLSEDDK